jgi:16S rRNA (guanine1207-N2)-methyltransferase
MGSFEVYGLKLEFSSTPDLFSPKALDQGTALLLNNLPGFDYASALDWGCGWGAIAMWLAKNNPEANVTAIDSDIAAVNATKENAASNHLSNLSVLPSHGFSAVPNGEKFDLILSNPPTHRGREVVDNMIKESKDRLNSHSKLVLVVEARIKPWVARQMKEVFGNYKILKRSSKHVVLVAQNGL